MHRKDSYLKARAYHYSLLDHMGFYDYWTSKPDRRLTSVSECDVQPCVSAGSWGDGVRRIDVKYQLSTANLECGCDTSPGFSDKHILQNSVDASFRPER